MPQIMIDTAAESPASLRLLITLLTGYMALGEVGDTDFAVLVATGPQDDIPPGATLDPAQIFGKQQVPEGTNVIPFPSPQVPTIQIPVTPAALPPVTDTPVSVPAAGSPETTVSTTATVAGTAAAVEFDKAGIPWDVRIHQSNRNQKTDGTWMLKRGLDKTLAATVLAELTAAKLPAKPSALAPMSLPPPPPVVPVPAVQTQAPTALPTTNLPMASIPSVMPLPPVSNGLPATPVELFKAMMAKIGPALAAQTITGEQVALAHQALGLPQLQLAITRPELIPLIEAALGL